MNKSIVDCEVELEVPFFDVDLMEIVWHGHYVKYFEIARCALLDKIGYGYMEMRDSGFTWPVIDIRVRYAKAAKFEQKLIIYAGITEWENRLKINYAIFDKSTRIRLTHGHTYQVAVNIITNEMCYESPTILLQKLGVVSH
mgnify:FL=1|jgi:acyl-CoA thioester hydrolase